MHITDGNKGRLIRGLTAAGYVTEKGDGLYGANHWTAHISSRRGQSTMNFVYGFMLLTRFDD